jgi:hypothetical protein
VTVVLPTQYSVNTVNTVGSDTMFGLMKEYTVAAGTLIKNIAENSFSINPCETYRENDNVG